MKTRWNTAAIATLVALGLMFAPPAYAADEDRLGIELPCSPRRDQRVVHRMTDTFTVSAEGSQQEKAEQSGRSARTLAIDYHVSPGHVDLRMSVDGTTLPVTLRVSKRFELERLVFDDPRAVSEEYQAFMKSSYGPLFKQATAFCGQRWLPGESRRIDFPFPAPPEMKFDVSASVKLLRVAQLYGRRALEFEMTMTGRMAFAQGAHGNFVGSGTSWLDVDTGVTLDSVFVGVGRMFPEGRMQTDSPISAGLDRALVVLRFELKEERRLDMQASRF